MPIRFIGLTILFFTLFLVSNLVAALTTDTLNNQTFSTPELFITKIAIENDRSAGVRSIMLIIASSYLSMAWIIAYSILYRFPERRKLLLFGTLLSTLLAAIGTYSLMFNGQEPSFESVILSGGVGGAFVACHYIAFIGLPHHMKEKIRRRRRQLE